MRWYENRIGKIHGRHSVALSNMCMRKQSKHRDDSPWPLGYAAKKRKYIPLAIPPDAALKAIKIIAAKIHSSRLC